MNVTDVAVKLDYTTDCHWCEKPIVISAEQRAVILRYLGQHGHEVSVGCHERCWEPFMANERKLREIFQEGTSEANEASRERA